MYFLQVFFSEQLERWEIHWVFQWKPRISECHNLTFWNVSNQMWKQDILLSLSFIPDSGMDSSLTQLYLYSQEGENFAISSPTPNFSADLKQPIAANALAGRLTDCTWQQQKWRNQALCRKPLAWARGMWENANSNPSQPSKLACKRLSFLRNYWIKCWAEPARFHWNWL